MYKNYQEINSKKTVMSKVKINQAILIAGSFLISWIVKQNVTNGYALEVNVYGKESGKQSAAYGENESGSIGDTQDVECAELVLTYDYSIPILGSKSTHTVRGNVN